MVQCPSSELVSADTACLPSFSSSSPLSFQMQIIPYLAVCNHDGFLRGKHLLWQKHLRLLLLLHVLKHMWSRGKIFPPYVCWHGWSLVIQKCQQTPKGCVICSKENALTWENGLAPLSRKVAWRGIRSQGSWDFNPSFYIYSQSKGGHFNSLLALFFSEWD